MSLIRRFNLTLIAAAAGWCFGWLAGSVPMTYIVPSRYPFLSGRVPLPHRVPQYAGGVSFRFAMAHDVIHERFAKHGPAYYRERDRLAREKLRDLAADDPEAFALADDVGVGLERLGRTDEAVATMRDKLARQQAKGLDGRELYTTYANLGTFLIHGNFKAASAGDAQARERFREGVGFIRKSVEVNPEAHFGRERWQAAIAEFLLAAMDDPALLKTYDCIGDRLDVGIAETLDREANWTDTGYGRAYDAAFAQGKADAEIPTFFRPGEPVDDPALWPGLKPIRKHITKVGAEDGWEAVATPSHRAPAPFDEPTLGIIGMWRQGGGANPHFALALGEIMLRVGQRYIAWAAFERAFRLADRYGNAPDAQEHLRAHCRQRQAEIEARLATESPATAAGLRAEFDAELAFGEGYRKDYQDFEARKIAAGASIADPHFFDDFPRMAEAIASPSGPEEWYARAPRKQIYAYLAERRTALCVFWAGLAAMIMAGCCRIVERLAGA